MGKSSSFSEAAQEGLPGSSAVWHVVKGAPRLSLGLRGLEGKGSECTLPSTALQSSVSCRRQMALDKKEE